MIRLALLSFLLVAPSLAGPLDPPAGPIAPTPGPEPRIAINATNTPGDADSLFKITQPGSYYLTGNIAADSSRHGIEIAASGVTVDLSGFDLVGIFGFGAFDGVNVSIAGARNIALRNGSIRNWGGQGIDFGTAVAVNCRIDDVRVSGNNSTGIFVGNSTSLSNCSASFNGANGFGVGSGNILTSCLATSNASNGFAAGDGNTLSGCSASGNNANGITVGNGGIVSNCTASSNATNGINAGGGAIIGCTSHLNGLNGIFSSSGSFISGNTCTNNGNTGSGAGIHTTGGESRIENNNCNFADRGIDVDAPGNIILRNSCTGNSTNWTIVAGNVVGPILDRTTPGSAAINGNSAPDSTGSAHPNANFSH
jgi:hypothetical protein